MDTPSTVRTRRRAAPARALTDPPADEGDDGVDREQFVLAFARGLDIIRSFSDRQRSMTMAEVSAATGIPRAAVRRMLLTLVRLGYAECDEQHYRLTAKTLQLSYAYVCADKLASLATPSLTRLSESLKAFCGLSLKQGDESMLIATSRLTVVMPFLRSTPHAGGSQPLYCAASGLVFLSQLEAHELEAYLKRVKLQSFTHRTVSSPAALRELLHTVREQGYAIQDRTMSPLLRSVAVPLPSSRSQPLAIVVVVESELITNAELQQRMVPAMKKTAQEIGALLRSEA